MGKTLTQDDFEKMLKGIISFAKEHEFDIRFGEKRDRYMKSDNFGLIELRLKCGCLIIFGLLEDRTYHLHSIELVEKDKKKLLFEV